MAIESLVEQHVFRYDADCLCLPHPFCLYLEFSGRILATIPGLISHSAERHQINSIHFHNFTFFSLTPTLASHYRAREVDRPLLRFVRAPAASRRFVHRGMARRIRFCLLIRLVMKLAGWHRIRFDAFFSFGKRDKVFHYEIKTFTPPRQPPRAGDQCHRRTVPGLGRTPLHFVDEWVVLVPHLGLDGQPQLAPSEPDSTSGRNLDCFPDILLFEAHSFDQRTE